MPAWAQRLVSGAPHTISVNNIALRVLNGDACTFITARVEQARSLAEESFTRVVSEIYDAIIVAARQLDRPHVVRMWNLVPGINDPSREVGIDRYMRFNAGRYASMRSWFEETDLAEHVPAATGVGHAGDTFVAHAMLMDRAARILQNPRQTPATGYSARYGPKPPCFSRASIVQLNHAPLLLVSGTAAILGEESVHDERLNAQLDLTLSHLSDLVTLSRAAGIDRDETGLAAYQSLRVYVADERHLEACRERIEPTFVQADIEYVIAPLCRPELMVEIEGTAA